ncbi:hypothetical protein PHLCEN_2v1901 [Hermanssonia centrifuga]|uniref:Uncharacterized protein n=1 Tax=Hermanssonia centrifuga TaxID=98765 RepID=A0A2R6RVM5_9APHY|nr:hypothetical protein PHLCEN_2v1901 [Hermanssonia centrifuga]
MKPPRINVNQPSEETTPFTLVIPFTLSPEGGFPCVHFDDALGMYDNISQKQYQDWRNFPRTSEAECVLVQVYNQGPPAPKMARAVTDKIKHTLTCLIGYNKAMISYPTPMNPSNRDSKGETKAAPHSEHTTLS